MDLSLNNNNKCIGWQFYICCFLLIVTTVYVNYFFEVEVIPPKKSFSEYPENVENWVKVKDHFFDDKVMDALRVDDFIYRTYRKNGRPVQLYIGYYRTQRNGAQIHSPKHCLPGSGWFEISHKIRVLPLDRGQLKFVEAVYQKGTNQEVFLYWYDVQGKKITNEYLLKMNMIYSSLMNNRSDGSFIRISTPVLNNDVDSAIRTVEEFALKMLPIIDSFLPVSNNTL